MLQLFNGCTCSNPSVFPANWDKSAKSIQSEWYIQYYFYDPQNAPKGKLQIIKAGINRIKDYSERKQAVKLLLDELIHLLKVEGYNPITRQKGNPDRVFEIEPHTPFIEALKQVFTKLKIAKSTTSDINIMLNHIETAAVQTSINRLPICEIKRKHIKVVLEAVSINRGFSAHRHNKYRSYLMILFKELVELDAIENNPVVGIKIEKRVKLLRDILTIDERKIINEYLKVNHYEFWRFMQVFFHSGDRIEEILRLKVSSVDSERQYYKSVIFKGKAQREVLKPIKDIVLPIWYELLADAKPNDNVFSEGLIPGPKQIRREQITRRWKNHVKDKLGVKADFYSLKHLNLDETAAALDIEAAARAAGHTSTVITMKHYATGEAMRQNEKIKNVKNKFA